MRELKPWQRVAIDVGCVVGLAALLWLADAWVMRRAVQVVQQYHATTIAPLIQKPAPTPPLR